MDLPVSGPYKATQTWNELVELFRFGIPLKKHRKHIKVYESSFTGIEAVHFFQEVLKKKINLSSDISKEQTIKLLDKFLKANIFQPANNISKKELTFKANGDLYQLSSFSSSNYPLPILNDISLDSNERISFPKISHKSKLKRIKSKENNIHINVKKNDICKSHKDINALKNFNQEKEILTINNVPKTSIKRFPNKLQNDSFNKNPATFLINKESVKIPIVTKLNPRPELISFKYSNPPHQNIQKNEITKMVILSKLERILFKMNINCSKLKSVPADWILNNLQQSLNEINSKSFLPEPILIKINNLYKTTPYDTLREKDIRFISNYFSFLERPLLTYQLYDIIISIYKYIENYNESVSNKSGNLDDNLSHHSYFETAFTSESPVTRIIPFKKSPTRFKRNISAETLSYKEQFDRNKNFSQTISSFDSITPKVSHLRNKSGGYLNPALCHSLDDLDQVNFDYVEALNSLQRLMQCSKLPSKHSVSSPSLWNDSSSECSFYTAKSNSPQPNLHSGSEDKLNTTLQDLQEPEIFNFIPITWNKDAQILGVTAMQLLLLFIPTECRAQLILLLQTIKHILNRKEHFIHMFIYSTFSLSILRSENYIQTNLSLIYKTIEFLVQNYESIIHISPQLVNEVERKIISFLNKQDKKRMPFSFCERISSEQFEQQRYTESQKALCQLLDHIINDNMMNDKNKKMRLKMFKEAYPHIYLEKFPEEIDENDISSKSRNRNFPSLMRIKNLRL